MIRDFTDDDLPRARTIHDDNGLPEECFPDLVILDSDGNQIRNPLFVIKSVFEHENASAMMCFLKVTSELYLLVDHNIGTPEQRWEWLQQFKEFMKARAARYGFSQMTAFVPGDIEESFAKRLEELGFVRSRFHPWTLNLD